MHDRTAAVPARIEALRALVGYGGHVAEEALAWARTSERPTLRATAHELADVPD